MDTKEKVEILKEQGYRFEDVEPPKHVVAEEGDVWHKFYYPTGLTVILSPGEFAREVDEAYSDLYHDQYPQPKGHPETGGSPDRPLHPDNIPTPTPEDLEKDKSVRSGGIPAPDVHPSKLPKWPEGEPQK